MEITNLPDAEFKTLLIRMSKEFIDDGHKIKKTTRNAGNIKWNKEKSTWNTSSGGDKPEIQINDLEHKEEKSIQPEQQ